MDMKDHNRLSINCGECKIFLRCSISSAHIIVSGPLRGSGVDGCNFGFSCKAGDFLKVIKPGHLFVFTVFFFQDQYGCFLIHGKGFYFPEIFVFVYIHGPVRIVVCFQACIKRHFFGVGDNLHLFCGVVFRQPSHCLGYGVVIVPG